MQNTYTDSQVTDLVLTLLLNSPRSTDGDDPGRLYEDIRLVDQALPPKAPRMPFIERALRYMDKDPQLYVICASAPEDIRDEAITMYTELMAELRYGNEGDEVRKNARAFIEAAKSGNRDIRCTLMANEKRKSTSMANPIYLETSRWTQDQAMAAIPDSIAIYARFLKEDDPYMAMRTILDPAMTETAIRSACKLLARKNDPVKPEELLFLRKSGHEDIDAIWAIVKLTRKWPDMPWAWEKRLSKNVPVPVTVDIANELTDPQKSGAMDKKQAYDRAYALLHDKWRGFTDRIWRMYRMLGTDARPCQMYEKYKKDREKYRDDLETELMLRCMEKQKD